MNSLSYQDIVEEIGNNTEYCLSEIIRYTGKHKIKEENVAEHSFYTILNVLKLGEEIGVDEHIIYKAMAVAAVHDIAESTVGDLPFEFKAANPDIMQQFNEYEKETLLTDTIGIKPITYQLLRHYYDTDSEDISVLLVNELVEFADLIAAYQYANRELMLGNTSRSMQVIKERAFFRSVNACERVVQLNQRYNNALHKRGCCECK